MQTPAATPRDINPTEDGTALRIVWEDGHESVYLPFDLRMSCPCAGCVDEGSGRRTLTEATVPPGVYPTAINYVGRYALQFVWSGGHDTGFYSFDLLRELCACDECSASAENVLPEEGQ
jgi:DUF971 family protein